MDKKAQRKAESKLAYAKGKEITALKDTNFGKQCKGWNEICNFLREL